LASRSTFSFDLIFPGRARPLRSPGPGGPDRRGGVA